MALSCDESAAAITFRSSRRPELLILQEMNGQVKPYQLRQSLRLVAPYALTVEER
jgi:hypothetical protein